MLAEERREQILERINSESFVTVPDLAKQFGITDATVRRDLDLLANKNLLKRSHGGAIAIDTRVGHESEFDLREAQNASLKDLIARRAAKYINEGDCIGIDIGSTACAMTKYVKHIKGLNVITASIPVVNALIGSEDINVICTGGELSRKDKSLIGHNAIGTISEYILDKVFIGVAGISLDRGFTMFSIDDTLVKRALVENSKQVIILADSSKFGQVRHAYFANVDIADVIITDKGIGQEYLADLQSKGIKVIIADGEDHGKSGDI